MRIKNSHRFFHKILCSHLFGINYSPGLYSIDFFGFAIGNNRGACDPRLGPGRTWTCVQASAGFEQAAVASGRNLDTPCFSR